MKLSVIVPVLNEVTFVPLYLESVAAFADEIIMADGGSTDGTAELIDGFRRQYPIKFFTMRQTGLPYSEDWNESLVRNFLIEQASGDWIMNLDIDEMMEDRFREDLPELMGSENVDIYQFPFVNFWKDPWTLRVNSPGDERWSNDITRMWRASRGIRYRDEKHHCTLQGPGGVNIWNIPRARSDVKVYHYHYAIGKRIKFNDNRRGDVNLFQNEGDADWNFTHSEYAISTAAFVGQHPAVIRRYLRKQSN
ncbi:glycosyltransferase involved in cell wall biosynthesis [Fontibacillus phaseoli]|uniref:Glycosyltransferase involved in cell wall biosynthesis n=1 Tax=Fontibacillus phaseoli TaxID=1416533 RepID=A0A369B688_9BACL|nr:glycosyltransferase [Fontibacillus phaseoli]RCX16951.1 glycosyltransferase involved in cell wall biosynthesis [Fontibacillus phaseoli]